MKRLCTSLVILFLLFSTAGCSQEESTSDWDETYAITGTENTQLWELKADDFLSRINSLVKSSDMELSYLKEYNPANSNCMLTKNGETWKIMLDIFSENEAGASWFKKNANAEGWIGYIEDVELSLYASDTKAAEENGYYLRYLISIFTPGAEEYVENALGIYDDPNQDTTVLDGVNQICMGNVRYSYVSGKSFMVEPWVEEWPAEESVPSVIRPQ